MGRVVCIILGLVMLAAPAWAELEIIVIPDTTEIQPYNERFHAAVPVQSANWQDSAFLALGRKILGKAAGVAGIVYSLESARQEVALKLQDGTMRIDGEDPFSYDTFIDLIAEDHGIETDPGYNISTAIWPVFGIRSSSSWGTTMDSVSIGDVFHVKNGDSFDYYYTVTGVVGQGYHSAEAPKYFYFTGNGLFYWSGSSYSSWTTDYTCVRTAAPPSNDFDPADYPDVFGDDVIEQNADESLRQRMEHLYATAVPFDGVGRPDYGPVFEIQSVSDVDGDGHVEGLTGTGYVDLPDGIADAMDISSVPHTMETDISGMTYSFPDGSTGLVSSADASIFEAAGIPSDSTILSYNPDTRQVMYRDGAGTHTKTLTEHQMSEISGSVKKGVQIVGSSSPPGTPVAEQDLDYDSPEFDGSFDPFNSTVTIPEKKAIPLHDWVASIPFAGLLASTTLDVGAGSSVVETDLTLLGQTGHVAFDFSQYESLLSMMGNIIFALASFLALRMALVKK